MTVNRDRKLVSRCKEDIDLEYETLGSAADTIQRLIALYGAHARISSYQAPYSDYENLGVFVDEPETDAEMAQRIDEEQRCAQQQADRERAEFERLRAKFGG